MCGLPWITIIFLINGFRYCDVIMSTMASQITSVSFICSTVCWGTDERKHQSSASLAFVRGIHRWPVDSPHRGRVTRKMFPFDDVIMSSMMFTGGCITLENHGRIISIETKIVIHGEPYIIPYVCMQRSATRQSLAGDWRPSRDTVYGWALVYKRRANMALVSAAVCTQGPMKYAHMQICDHMVLE